MSTTTTFQIREVKVNYRVHDIDYKPASNPESAYQLIKALMVAKDCENSQENMIAVYLDSQNKPTGFALLSIGAMDECIIDPRVLFQKALLYGAIKILLAHNHPSGNCSPSEEDINATKTINQGAKILGLELLDHLVITDSKWLSIHQEYGKKAGF